MRNLPFDWPEAQNGIGFELNGLFECVATIFLVDQI